MTPKISKAQKIHNVFVTWNNHSDEKKFLSSDDRENFSIKDSVFNYRSS